MTLIGQAVLNRTGRRNAPLRRWLATWTVVVESAGWHSTHDVRRDYPATDGVRLASGTVVTVFNVKGNDYRLLTVVDYPEQTVIVLDVISHAEYDKELWKERY